MAQLIAKTGPDEGSVFPLFGDVTTVGRHSDNNIELSDAAASRFHAQILRREGRYYIRDLDSSHGTFVNEVRNNQELLLSDNDRIRIGATELVFKIEEMADRESASPSPTADMDQLAGVSGETIAISLPTDKSSPPSGLSSQGLEMLSRVAEATQSVFDLNELLGTLMDMIFDIFGPDRGVVLMCEEKEGPLTSKVTRPAEGKLKISQTIINHAIEQRMSLLVTDTAEDDRFSDAKSIMAQSIESAICSPLVSKDKVLGVLYIDSQSRPISYQKEDLALLNIIAANAAISIENAVLVQEKLEAERLAAIGVAVAGISHYVKNILMGMSGSSSLIDMGLSTENFDLVKESWPILQRSSKKISSLVQDMLTYSKKREPEWSEGNLNSLLHEIYENQSPRAMEDGVEFLMDLEEPLPDSQFDHTAIHDTLLNIVGNAIEACKETPGTSVVLRSKSCADAGQLCVSISDNGPGIPPEIQNKIFEPFFSTKGSGGTGLGLAVARKTVEEHRGRLLLESETGKGTSFNIYLPVRAIDAEDTQPNL